MNIEEIKKRARKNELLPACDLIDLSDDVSYLLSIIEQAEKALEEIYNVESLCERDSLLYALTEVNQIADKALQAIRKGD